MQTTETVSQSAGAVSQWCFTAMVTNVTLKTWQAASSFACCSVYTLGPVKQRMSRSRTAVINRARQEKSCSFLRGLTLLLLPLFQTVTDLNTSIQLPGDPRLLLQHRGGRNFPLVWNRGAVYSSKALWSSMLAVIIQLVMSGAGLSHLYWLPERSESKARRRLCHCGYLSHSGSAEAHLHTRVSTSRLCFSWGSFSGSLTSRDSSRVNRWSQPGLMERTCLSNCWNGFCSSQLQPGLSFRLKSAKSFPF